MRDFTKDFARKAQAQRQKTDTLVGELTDLIREYGAFDVLIALELAFDELPYEYGLSPNEKRATGAIARALRRVAKIAEPHNI